ncbi:putative transporter [Venustampulla echinocandica]|uniref:Putative transporter n=1 Tax=Venustampulla echinocandica TaxID=2656787 RepID=A0A370TDD5_9HELO|nr:putative transporter [Venustampulla echinocandica]RDL32483.1 putative transporter [Venustampulla echinocandica]
MISDPERAIDEKGPMADSPPSESHLGAVSKTALDDGLEILEGRGDEGGYVLDPAMKRRILWKIDLHILPLLTLTTVFGYLDKATFSYGAIFGLIKDANLHGSQYSWLGSIYYFGYLAMQPIAAIILQRFAPPRCLAVAIFSWAVILFLSVLCKSFEHWAPTRFFLGVAEGIVVPSFILISSAWYARKDQALRIGIWFSANGIAQIVGGISSYGLGQIHVNGLSPWKWMFMIVGAASVFFSLLLGFTMPTSQATASWLTHDEKIAAVEMVRGNNTGIHNKKFVPSQVKEALLDPKTYIFFWFAFFGNLPNSVSVFGTLIVSNFGFSPVTTTLLGMPNGGFEIVVMVAITYLCIRIGNIRTWGIVVSNIIALLGGILLKQLPFHNKEGLLIGYYLLFAWPTGYALSLAIVGSNTAGHTKKVVTNGFVLAGFCTSNIIAPQFFLTSQQPRYGLGIGSTIFAFAAMTVTALVFRFYMIWLNKKRAPAREAALATLEGRRETGFENLTDRENPLFVYVY